ncbi:aspartate ammonia-lyase [Cocleimonas sp. KMM 6892]|uniref:aspartate ammonia-lyase n=1 Tax=unclassified Cocleimonas TaxID=2639732 RepID=UPI002DC03EF1|nr:MULTISPECIES: aspartate ammonia-lyase [unclassified Cocleimonas]MEB8433783.1 aspartate ammonia-lyase [Cocleimonas sp. KMM 6892]MEC4716594.1 aspartate ammonia-lyase [Cocleimonas sp. KMM 6895]MEC4746251.1 aspartate ammonia-lyase [Cocleimonas sp. KMM 6896]
MAIRTEKDFLGSLDIPKDAYYGVHTARALENFTITGVQINHFPRIIIALAMVKKATLAANLEFGLIDEKLAAAINQACDEIIDGKLHEHFVVDLIQGGAGTSTNMNANEVIANRALEILGHEKGSYKNLHPNDHVNLSQSTNDVYPTAFRVGLLLSHADLLAALEQLIGHFKDRAELFKSIYKIGRTQLQDAVPMTLGQEFQAFADTLSEEKQRFRDLEGLLGEVGLGGTAIGTGVNAPKGFAAVACKHLADISGFSVTPAANPIEATSDTGIYLTWSGVLRRTATKLSKICNDLRLLSCGPRAGIGEINLPPVQAGSSIMPGKVNPVIPEMVNQVAYQVMGNDLTVMLACEGGQLQLNAFEPVMVANLFQSIDIMKRAMRILGDRCVSGITPNIEHCQKNLEKSITLVTLLNPQLGYEISSEIAVEALTSKRTIRELILERNLMSSEDYDALIKESTELD